MKKITMLDYVCITIVLVGVAGALLLPATGELVLIDELCSNAAVLGAGFWLLKATIVVWRGSGWKNRLLFGVLTIVVLTAGAAGAIDCGLDMVQGNQTVVLTDCNVEKRGSSKGIVSLDYYLHGTDASGKAYQFVISGRDYEKLQHKTSVTIVGYVNTERTITCR